MSQKYFGIQKAIVSFAAKILPLFFDITVINEGVLGSLKKPFIVASMHKTYIDFLFLAFILRSHEHFLPIRAQVDDWWMEKPFWGRLLKTSGAITRKKTVGGIKASLSKTEMAICGGGVALIYPEGKIYPSYGIGKLYGGAARLSVATGAPILPIALVGLEGLSLWDLPSLFRVKKQVLVVIGNPIQNMGRDRKAFNEKLKNRLQLLYAAYSR